MLVGVKTPAVRNPRSWRLLDKLSDDFVIRLPVSWSRYTHVYRNPKTTDLSVCVVCMMAVLSRESTSWFTNVTQANPKDNSETKT